MLLLTKFTSPSWLLQLQIWWQEHNDPPQTPPSSAAINYCVIALINSLRLRIIEIKFKSVVQKNVCMSCGLYKLNTITSAELPLTSGSGKKPHRHKCQLLTDRLLCPRSFTSWVSLKDDGTDDWSTISLNWAVVHGLDVNRQTSQTMRKAVIFNWAVKQDDWLLMALHAAKLNFCHSTIIYLTKLK